MDKKKTTANTNNTKLVRLSHALSIKGIASRRKAEEIITSKRVKVNGKVALLPQTKVDLSKDIISIDNKPITKQLKKVYFMLNKPSGYVCSNTKKNNEKIIFDIFKDLPYRLFSAGRLDKSTTGLIILTNDGEFANKIIHPSSNITKEYLVKTHELITYEHLKQLSHGVRIDGQWIKPKRVLKIRKGTCKIAVTEGKKHEVRKFCEKANLTILELKRIRLGQLTLGGLPEGSFRPLSSKEKDLFT
jgi:23S rRNA pseudouridine2605 synthase